jgi:hypothetical protein
MPYPTLKQEHKSTFWKCLLSPYPIQKPELNASETSGARTDKSKKYKARIGSVCSVF